MSMGAMGGKDLSFCVGLKAPFTNNNASQEERMLGKTLQQVVVQRNVERHQSERVILLGLDECQSSELHLDLGNLSGNSNNEDRLRVSKERIRTRKYLGEKLLPPHYMHYSSFPGRINVKKTSEQCFQTLSPTENQKSCSVGQILECRVG